MGWLSATVLARGVEAPLADVSLSKSAEGARDTARWFSRMQTGDLQGYLVYALLGLIAMFAWGASHV
jgi:hypothetical protein